MKQCGDVFIVQRIDTLPPDALYTHEGLVAEHAQLMRYRGLLNFERVNQLTY